MDFAFNDEQRDFQAVIRRFAQQKLASRYSEDDRRGGLDQRTISEMAALGLLGVTIAPEHGGQGADAISTGIAAEEIAAADFNAAYLLLIPLLAAEVISAAGDEAQRARMLPPIAAGASLPCFCLTEPQAGSDAAKLQCKAQRQGSGWRLTGEKTSASLGVIADSAVVFARTSDDGAKGISAFYVELHERYVQRSAFKDLGSKAIGRASIHFDGLPVAAEDLLGGVGEGFVRCMQSFEFSRAIIGLMCLGLASAALQEALQYCRDRETFGKPIGAHQGVAFPLVEAATLIKGARLICYEALWRRDEGLPHRIEANMVKWWAPKIAVETAHQALLTLGHAGYSEELPAGQRIRDLIGLEIGDGTAQIAKLVLARELLGRAYAP